MNKMRELNYYAIKMFELYLVTRAYIMSRQFVESISLSSARISDIIVVSHFGISFRPPFLHHITSERIVLLLLCISITLKPFIHLSQHFQQTTTRLMIVT